MIVVRGGTGKPVSSQKLADYFEARTDIDGYLYLGYPIIGTIEGGYPIDALFLSDQHGAIIFHLIEGIYDNTINISDIQDENYTKLESKLKQHNDLNKKKGLAVQLNVATFASAWIGRSDIKSEYPVLVTEDTIAGNVRESSPTEIWHSTKAQEMRKTVKNCQGCLNSWGTYWSFESSCYPYLLFSLKHPAVTIVNLKKKK